MKMNSYCSVLYGCHDEASAGYLSKVLHVCNMSSYCHRLHGELIAELNCVLMVDLSIHTKQLQQRDMSIEVLEDGPDYILTSRGVASVAHWIRVLGVLESLTCLSFIFVGAC